MIEISFGRNIASPPKGIRVSGAKGYTFLELIVVIFLISLLCGLSTLHFANTLPSYRLAAAAREMTATIKQARSLARVNNERQAVVFALDHRKYGLIDSPSMRAIPEGVHVKVIDPVSGEIQKRDCVISFNNMGGSDGSTIILWNEKKSIRIELDPIIGAVAVK